MYFAVHFQYGPKSLINLNVSSWQPTMCFVHVVMPRFEMIYEKHGYPLLIIERERGV